MRPCDVPVPSQSAPCPPRGLPRYVVARRPETEAKRVSNECSRNNLRLLRAMYPRQASGWQTAVLRTELSGLRATPQRVPGRLLFKYIRFPRSGTVNKRRDSKAVRCRKPVRSVYRRCALTDPPSPRHLEGPACLRLHVDSVRRASWIRKCFTTPDKGQDVGINDLGGFRPSPLPGRWPLA